MPLVKMIEIITTVNNKPILRNCCIDVFYQIEFLRTEWNKIRKLKLLKKHKMLFSKYLDILKKV